LMMAEAAPTKLPLGEHMHMRARTN
jgi:hypothetical protein